MGQGAAAPQAPHGYVVGCSKGSNSHVIIIGYITTSSRYVMWIVIGSDRRPETSKELKEKWLGSDREGLGLGIIDSRSEPHRRPVPNGVFPFSLIPFRLIPMLRLGIG